MDWIDFPASLKIETCGRKTEGTYWALSKKKSLQFIGSVFATKNEQINHTKQKF